LSPWRRAYRLSPRTLGIVIRCLTTTSSLETNLETNLETLSHLIHLPNVELPASFSSAR
jgi:hypothetical protein